METLHPTDNASQMFAVFVCVHTHSQECTHICLCICSCSMCSWSAGNFRCHSLDVFHCLLEKGSLIGLGLCQTARLSGQHVSGFPGFPCFCRSSHAQIFMWGSNPVPLAYEANLKNWVISLDCARAFEEVHSY